MTNRQAELATDRIMPLRVPAPAAAAAIPPPMGPGVPPAAYPANFPATKGALLALSGAAIDNLLTAYLLPVGGGTIAARKNLLAEHLGMRGPIA